MATTISDILADREKTHGSYVEHAEISNVTYEFWASRRGFAKLTHDQRETLKMIAHKVGRVLAGNPEFADHWDDQAGYATLSADLIRTRNKAREEAIAPSNANMMPEEPYSHQKDWPT